MIPKKIHYCWFGRNPLPKVVEECMASWRRVMPEAEIIRWDESNYDVTAVPYVAAAYKAKKWAFVSDYVRLDVIYREGGIYLDVDVELLKPLDPLLTDRAFCGREDELKVNTGLVLAAEAGHPIVRGMRDAYLGYQYLDEKDNFSSPACPVLQTDYLRPLGLLPMRSGYQDIQGIRVYPQEYFNPVDEFGVPHLTSNSYCLHHAMASWLPAKWRFFKAIRRAAERVCGPHVLRMLVGVKRIFWAEYK